MGMSAWALGGVECYREAVQATEGLLDYYALEGELADAVDGGNGANDAWTPAAGPPFVEGVFGEGRAIELNGTNQFLRIARSIQGDFTIIAWLKTDAPGIGSAASQFYQGSGFIYADVGGIANDFGTAVTGNVFAFGLGNPDQTIHSTAEVVTGEWIQVVAVRDVDEDAGISEYRIYIDGVLDGEGIHPNASPLNASATITIGGNTIDARYYKGAIDEVALFTEALDEDTVIALRDAAEKGMAEYRAAVEDTEGLVDYYDFEGRYGDTFAGDDGFNDPTNVVSTRVPTFDAGLGDEGECLLFDGIDDYISISRSIQDDFTIMAWMRADLPQIGTVESQYHQGSGFIYADVPGIANDFGTAVTGTFFAFGAGNPDETIHSSTPVTEGEWVHVAATRRVEGGGATLRLYVNGVLEGELRHANASPLSAASTITIGGNTIDARHFGGSIDEIALFSVALDEEVIAELYEAAACAPSALFRRGDVDSTGTLTIGDAIFLLNYQFAGGPAPLCLDAADVDDSGSLTIGDAIYLLSYQFASGAAPPPPGAIRCGADPTPDPWTPQSCRYPQALCR